MILWSDDCGWCLCGLPHTDEQHMERVDRALEELEQELQAFEEWEHDNQFDEDDEGEK